MIKIMYHDVRDYLFLVHLNCISSNSRNLMKQQTSQSVTGSLRTYMYLLRLSGIQRVWAGSKWWAWISADTAFLLSTNKGFTCMSAWIQDNE